MILTRAFLVFVRGSDHDFLECLSIWASLMLSYDEFGILHFGPSYQRRDGVPAGGTFCMGGVI